MLETIKSYLVSLGFAVDQNSYNEATKSMDNAEKSVAHFAGSAVAKFAAAGAAVTTFVATAVVGIAKFIGGLAQADLANEKLARQLWTTKENAAAFNNTLKAMGVSLQDLYLSPELMHNFQLLREQSNQMRPPAEFADQMKLIRSIQFEFTRMKLEATYALQWIGYYFVKYMQGPITQIKLTLKDINDTIIKTMPHWTKVVAEVMSWFGRMGVASVRAIKDIARVFDDIGDVIPRNIKLIGAAIIGLGLILRMGPVGMLITAFTTLLLLLDDFYTYLDGGESKFGPFWKKIIDFYDKIRDSGAIDAFKKGLTDAFESISKGIDQARRWLGDFYDDLGKNGTLDNLQQAFTNTFDVIQKLFDGAKTWVQDLWTELGKQGVLTDLKKSFEDVFGAVSNLLKTVTELIDKLLGLDDTKKTLSDIGKLLQDTIIVALQTIDGLLKGIAGYIDVISSVLGGNALDKNKEAGKQAEDRLNQQPNQGFFGGMLQDITDLFTKWKSPNFSDKVSRALGLFSQSMEPPKYTLPGSNTQPNSNNVTLSQTNNIYGSDPKATADAAQSNMDSFYMRNMRGVVR